MLDLIEHPRARIAANFHDKVMKRILDNLGQCEVNLAFGPAPATSKLADAFHLLQKLLRQGQTA